MTLIVVWVRSPDPLLQSGAAVAHQPPRVLEVMLSLAARAGSPSGSESPAHNVCPDPAVSRTVARYASSALGSRSERGGLLLCEWNTHVLQMASHVSYYVSYKTQLASLVFVVCQIKCRKTQMHSMSCGVQYMQSNTCQSRLKKLVRGVMLPRERGTLGVTSMTTPLNQTDRNEEPYEPIR